VQTFRAVPTAADVPWSSIRPASRIGLALAALMVSIPFLNFHHSFPLPSFYTEWMAFFFGTAALVAIARDGRVALPPLSLGLLGLALVLLLQVTAGTVAYVERSLIGAGYAIWAALLVWLGVHLREHCGLDRLTLVLQAAIVSGGFLVAISGFLVLYQIEWAGVGIVSGDGSQGMAGTLAQRNHFANYLACAIACVVFLYGRRRLSLPLAVAIVAPMVLGLVLSLSRSAAVFLTLVAISGCWAFRQDRAQFRRVALLCVGLLVAFGALAVLADSIPWLAGPARPEASLVERWIETVAPDRSALTSQIRLYLLKEAWAMFAAHPLLGVGFGEFAWNLLERAADFDGSHSVMMGNAHNALLQLLAETGLLGTVCVAVPFLMWLRAFPWTEKDEDTGWMIAVLAVQAAHSMVEYPLWHANFLGLAALLLGAGGRPAASPYWGRLRRPMLGLVLAAGLAVLGVALSDYRDFEGWYRQAERSPSEPISEAQLQRLQDLHAHSLFAGYYDVFAAEMIPLNREHMEEKLALNAYALRFFPIADTVFRQAVLLALSGERGRAAAMYLRFVTMYPEDRSAFLDRLERMARSDPAALGELAGAANRMTAR
jgi:O-antigen ligase